MDIKRMTVFFAVSLLILLGWEKIFPTPQPAVSAVQQAGQQQNLPDYSGRNRFESGCSDYGQHGYRQCSY